jgi:peptide/nickel transport system substrate-binding protein
MIRRHERSAALRAVSSFGALAGLVVLAGTARCSNRSGPVTFPTAATLRVGIGGLSQVTPQAGLRQLVANLSVEGLVNLTEDGHPRPWLVESWITAPDDLSVILQLQKKAQFHDGTPVTASIVAQTLQQILPGAMGPAFEDVESIVPLDESQIQIRLRQPSRFLIEALETSLQKPGAKNISTGPYIVSGSATELRANTAYYLGPPTISRISLTPYPSVRAAWAELLRGNLDMLYEVNLDALDSLQASSSVSVFSFVRHYQYVIMFGAHSPNLQDAEIRRELNAAIDREAVVREALNGHGIPSSGPIPPRHWALDAHAPKLSFDPKLAANLSRRRLRFTCLVPTDSVYERIALVVKRQLAAVSVDMQVEERTQDQLFQVGQDSNFDALLIDVVSGPSVFRSYRHLYSGVPFVPKPMGRPQIDSALDRIRHASSDDDYRNAVTDFQRTIVDDPPELFLAWGERARAVSRRFDVPVPEDGRDILSTLRLWRPTPNQQTASRN